ncbi:MULTISPECIES: MoaD/ThiS family protein [Arthrobacter]|uniref:Molybdopterin synthase sulfur carrier subunit n=1 Tax=Arthrobacter psychrochitiniphilus TaxID=291045 RepID=A0A2V3DVR2_9MICC|nr:MoaD/ThiS family protein [Arthrobacter psychrochitiniphilus]NYG15510.1 molybdopterin converting factor small subunit [Arthrobacter psychrochitiniphilus]PXA66984.1 molybdopterin synthase sulfur carrier subunit [Arthrobacter psychrochitiniphilus]
MGEVRILVPTLLQPLVGGSAELRLEVGAGAPLSELLDAVAGEFPVFGRRVRDETGKLRRYVNIYLDGDEVRRLDGLETQIAAGQELMIIQSVAGG